MSLGAGRGGSARSLLCTVPIREGWGCLGPSLACLLAHCCHNQLVAQGCACEAALITIVTRASFLAGFVPLAAWQSGAVPSTEQGWLSSSTCVLPSLWQQPHLALPPSFLVPVCALSFSPLHCPRAPALVLEGPKSCSEEVP